MEPLEKRGTACWVFRPNQMTREVTAAQGSCHLRSPTIFSSGTRSPAPHQAAIEISGSMPACSANVALGCRNHLPAASTSSATQGCDAISGLPHSSRKTVAPLSSPMVQAPNLFDSLLHTCDYPFAVIARPNCAGDGGDVCVDVRQSLRASPIKRAPRNCRISTTAFS